MLLRAAHWDLEVKDSKPSPSRAPSISREVENTQVSAQEPTDAVVGMHRACGKTRGQAPYQLGGPVGLPRGSRIDG
jgi:hypothetical protein